MFAMCQTQVATGFQEAEYWVIEVGCLGLLKSKH
jgi:hypothetical protein